jgi:predicted dehydrogenase
MASRLRIGVIGTGFGALVQIPAFRANHRAEVVAVASGTPGKAKKTADGLGVPHAFDDWRKLVQADLDLVSITTPPALHHPMALAALAAGRHVLCEKPMAMSAAEAEDMLAHGDRARRAHVIDHELRFNPNRRRVRQLIQDGFIGAPRHVLLTIVNPDTTTAKP